MNFKCLLVLLLMVFFSFSVKAQFSGIGKLEFTEHIPTLDTIKVFLMVSDTNIHCKKIWKEYGYEVRYKHCCADGNTSEFTYYKPVPYFTHFVYLDNKKNPLKSNLIVWNSLPIK